MARAVLLWQDDKSQPVATITAVNGTAVTEGATFTVTEGQSIEVEASFDIKHASFSGNVPFTVTDTGGALTNSHTGFLFSAGLLSDEIEFTTDAADTTRHYARSVTFTLDAGDDLPYTIGSPSSVTVTVLDDDTPPSVPLAVRARPGDRQVTLTWEAPEDSGGGQPITHYQYRYKLKTGATWIQDWTDIPGGDADTRSYTRTGLTNDTEYTFELRAVNAVPLDGAAASRDVTPAVGIAVSLSGADFEAPEGGRIEVTATLAVPPAQGESVTVDLSATGLTGLEANEFSGVPSSVTFAAGEDEKTFTVRFTDDSEDERDEVLRIEVDLATLPAGYIAGSALELTVLDDDVTASIAASAESVAEDGGGSVEVTVTLADRPNEELTIPLRASGLQSGDYAADGAPPSSVTFGADETEKSFTVRLADDAAVETETLTLGFGSLPARVAADPDAASVTVTVVDDDGPPAAPVLSPTVGNGFVLLSWQAVENDSPVTGYLVRWKSADDAADFPSFWENVEATETSYRVDDLTNNTEYVFQVRAENGHGQGAVAETTAIPAVAVTAVPGPVNNLRVSAAMSSEAILEWLRPSNTVRGESRLQGYRGLVIVLYELTSCRGHARSAVPGSAGILPA